MVTHRQGLHVVDVVCMLRVGGARLRLGGSGGPAGPGAGPARGGGGGGCRRRHLVDVPWRQLCGPASPPAASETLWCCPCARPWHAQCAQNVLHLRGGGARSACRPVSDAHYHVCQLGRRLLLLRGGSLLLRSCPHHPVQGACPTPHNPCCSAEARTPQQRHMRVLLVWVPGRKGC